MRAETVKRHRRAVRTALDFVAGERDVPRLERIAEAAAMSPFHFAHVYEGYVGEPIIKTLRRRQMGQAARNLEASTGDVLGVALASGYRSGQAFARAYRRATGLTPTEARRAQAPSTSPEIRFVRLEERPSSGIPVWGSAFDEGDAFNELVAHAYADVALADISRFRATVRGVTVLTDGWPEPGRLTQRVPMVIAARMPSRFGGMTVPGGYYAVVRCNGSLAAAGAQVRAARARLRDEFGLTVTDRPILCEWVSDAALLLPDQFVLDIHLPIAR